VTAGTERIRLSLTPPAHYDLDFDVSAGWIFFDGPPCAVNCPPGTLATQDQIDHVLAGATALLIRGLLSSGRLGAKMSARFRLQCERDGSNA